MAQEIRWTRQAWKDLYNIYEFIANDSIRYAQIQIDEIREAISNLVKFPLMGRKVPEFLNLPYREILVGNYRIIYKTEKSKGLIIIMTIVHGRRLL